MKTSIIFREMACAARRRVSSPREFWMEAGMGIGGLALVDLLSRDQFWPRNRHCAGLSDPRWQFSLCAEAAALQGQGNAVISLFMCGGLSHIDTFQYKPALINTTARRSKATATSSCVRATPGR